VLALFFVKVNNDAKIKVFYHLKNPQIIHYAIVGMSPGLACGIPTIEVTEAVDW
jgi:hypothetical protein